MNKELKEHTAFEEVVAPLFHLALHPDASKHYTAPELTELAVEAHQRELNRAVVEELEGWVEEYVDELPFGEPIRYKLETRVNELKAKYTPKESE